MKRLATVAIAFAVFGLTACDDNEPPVNPPVQNYTPDNDTKPPADDGFIGYNMPGVGWI